MTNPENKSQGWVKVYRSLLDEWFYKDSHYVHLWVHLLLKANHQDSIYKDTKIKRGQLMTGRKRLEEETGINQHKIDRILKVFEDEQLIEQRMTTKGRIITIVSYDEHQNGAQQNEPKPYSTCAAAVQRVSTNKNDRMIECKNERNNIPPSSSLSKESSEVSPPKGRNKKKKNFCEDKFLAPVMLTEEEHKKLIKGWGISDTYDAIHEFAAYMKSRGKTYKSHYAALLNWIKRKRKQEAERAERQKTFEAKRRDVVNDNHKPFDMFAL